MTGEFKVCNTYRPLPSSWGKAVSAILSLAAEIESGNHSSLRSHSADFCRILQAPTCGARCRSDYPPFQSLCYCSFVTRMHRHTCLIKDWHLGSEAETMFKVLLIKVFSHSVGERRNDMCQYCPLR